MADDLVLAIRLTGDGKGLVQAVDAGSDELKKFVGIADKSDKSSRKAAKGQKKLSDRHRKSASTGKRLNNTYKNLSRTLLGMAAAYISVRSVGSLVSDFEKQDQAVAALDASIGSMGRTTKDLSIRLQELARQIQDEGIIGDEAIIHGQSFLATYSDITDELLPRTTRVMADLAAKMGGDVVSAANTMGKASMGMIGELSRIGITLSDAAKESKDFKIIIGEIESQVGGMNAALAATNTGGLKQFKNNWGDIKERMGEALAYAGGPTLRQLGQELDISAAATERWGESLLDALEAVTVGTAGIIDTIETPLAHVKSAAGEIWDGYQQLPTWGQEIGILGMLMLGSKGRIAILGALAAMGKLDVSEWEGIITADQFIKGTPEELQARLAEVDGQLSLWREKESRAWYDWQNALPGPTDMLPDQAALEDLRSRLVLSLAATKSSANDLPNIPAKLFGDSDSKDAGSAAAAARDFFARVRAGMNSTAESTNKLGQAAAGAGTATNFLADAERDLLDKLDPATALWNDYFVTLDELRKIKEKHPELTARVTRAEQELLKTYRDGAAALNKYNEGNKTREKIAETADEWDRALDLIIDQFEELDEQEARQIAGLDNIKNTGANTFKALEAAARGWGDTFTNTLADMVQQGKLDFADLANAIIADLLRIMIYQNITRPLLGAFGVDTGTTASVNHTGGIAGQSGARRNVPSAVFANAPRLHNGGIAGNEVPAILQRGEEVLPANDPRHIKNFGGGQGGNVRVFLENKSGTQLKATQGKASFDAQGMVIGVVLEDLDRDGPISNKLRATHGLQRATG